MSKWRKHVTSPDYVEPPRDGQEIVRAVGSRGSNLIEVELAGGECTLCLLPAKFNKKLWVKRGGYLIVALGDAEGTQSVKGTIVHVLYEDDVRRLKSMPDVWPAAFCKLDQASQNEELDAGLSLESLRAGLPEVSHGEGDSPLNRAESNASCRSSQRSAYSESDSELPALKPNRNRPIREFLYTDDDETSSEDI